MPNRYNLVSQCESTDENLNLRKIKYVIENTSVELAEIFLIQESIPTNTHVKKIKPKFECICTPHDLVRWPTNQADYWDPFRYYRASKATFISETIDYIKHIQETITDYVNNLFQEITQLETLKLNKTITIKDVDVKYYTSDVQTNRVQEKNSRLYIEVTKDGVAEPVFLLNKKNLVGIASPVDIRTTANFTLSNTCDIIIENNHKAQHILNSILEQIKTLRELIEWEDDNL